MSDDEQPIFSIGAVARMSGVPAATIRNWEQRYGLITPERSPGGHRLYSRRQVEQLELLKRELARGVQPAAAHRLIAAGEPSSEPSPAGGGGARILLAERDRYAAALAERVLRREGYEVVLVLDAAEAERAAVTHRPELAIVELTISGGVGVELCTWLKEHGVLACLAVSGLREPAHALANGADAFLEKPLEPLRFLATVKDLLRRGAPA